MRWVMNGRIVKIMGVVVTTSILLAACATPSATPTTTTTAPAATTGPAATTAPATTVRPTPTITAATGTAQYGGTLRLATSTHPSTLLPTKQPLKQAFLGALFDTLLKLDAKGELQPNLATEWKFGPDMKSLTLTLRKGVKFHDGTDLNAEAVKFNIEKRKKFRDYGEVSSVDVIDDYTVRLNLSEFANTLLVSLWFIPGMVTSPTTYQKLGDDDAQWQPSGTGPFKMVSYQHQVVGKFDRFDAYWQKGKPYLDRFEYHMIADETIRVLALKNNEVDWVAEGIPPRDVPDLTKSGFQVIKGITEVYNNFIVDSANAASPFSNKKVREAIEYGINREAIAESTGYGLREPLIQMAPQGEYAYNPNLKARAYDPAKAKQLLAEAGFPNGFKTTILTAFTIDDALVAVATQLKDLGIEATIDAAPIARFYENARKGWTNKMIYRAFRSPPDWLAYVDSMLNTGSQENVSMVKSPEVQDLLLKAKTATTMAEKKTVSQQLVKQVYDEAAVIPVLGSVTTTVGRKGVNNMGYYALWGPNELWSPADVWMAK